MNQQQKETLEKQIQKIEEDLANFRKIGVIAPQALSRSLGILSIAIKTGKDIGCAAWDTKKALEDFTKNLKQHCEPENIQCEIDIDRGYQNRAIKFLFNVKMDSGLFQNSVNRFLDNLGLAQKEIRGCVIELP